MIVYSNKIRKALPQRLSFCHILIGISTFLLPLSGYTQDETDEQIEEVVVTGTRQSIQTSIEIKRDADVIVDGLSSTDIGDIPALSIGEALETLVGASSHREQGGATEISIRGLGPYLGSTVINGRDATNGSGDRSVNFSQFPSELFNKLAIYKTQQASFVEGGTSGQIHLSTLRPLDYGKHRTQIEVKGSYNPDNDDINIAERVIGSRSTFSHVNQLELPAGNELGFSLGVQRNVTTNPEQEFRTTSGWRDCRNDPRIMGGVYRANDGNCDQGSGNLNLNADARNELMEHDSDAPFIFVPSSRSYRQNITDDYRESLFGALQWRNDKLDVNFDLQYSDRTFSEHRNDLVFAENRRIDESDGNSNFVATPGGAVSSFNNEGRIETHSYYMERIEEYLGGGLNIEYEINDRLRVSLDTSYSDTERRENIWQVRLQSANVDIFGESTGHSSGRVPAAYKIPGPGSEVPLITVTDFDVTNHDLFSNEARVRIDLNQYRNNTIKAGKGDFEWDPAGWGLIKSIKGGVRYSQLEFQSVPRQRIEEDDDSGVEQRGQGLVFTDDALAAANQACRNEAFPESGFLDEPSGGQNLITNEDDNGNVIQQGTGSTYATFDAMCLIRELYASVGHEVPDIPSAAPSVQNNDVEEDTLAFYLQADYDGEVGDYPIRGNFGLRVVNTDVNSKGLRTTFTTETDPGTGVISVSEDSDNFFSVSRDSSYTELLPSVNIALDLNRDTVLRGSIFRSLARPDPDALGFGRNLDVDDSGDPTSIAALAGSAVAFGNPDLEPLMSWNFDIAGEWYPNEDTILALGLYYKRFQGGFEQVRRTEQFTIDGQAINAGVTVTRTDEDTSILKGFELTAAHRLSYLPAPFDGLGGKLSYNHADSDFEFEDANFGDAVVTDEAGNVVSRRIGIVPPANLFGFSRNVLSAQAYYEIGGFDFQIFYKYRSEYFQQFVSTPGNLRYIGDTDVWEARITYKVNDNVALRLEGLNLTDEPRIQYNPTLENLAEVNSYGQRFFFGVRVKFF